MGSALRTARSFGESRGKGSTRGNQGYSSPVQFAIQIYRDLAQPPLFAGVVYAVPSVVASAWSGETILRFSADVAGPILDANTPYYIAIMDADGSTGGDFRWLRTEGTAPGNFARRPDEFSSWILEENDVQSDFVLQLDGVVMPDDILYTQEPRRSETFGLRSNLLVGPGTAETEQQLADDFTLATAATIGRITWQGLYYWQASLPAGKTTVDFTVRLYSVIDQAPIVDLPVSVPFAQVDSYGPGSSPIYEFSLDLASPITLQAGQRYWLSILERDASTSLDFVWHETEFPWVGTWASRRSPSEPWGVSGSVPNLVYTFTVKCRTTPLP